MNIFIICIGTIAPQSCFDCTNFRASLVIKIINFNEIKKGPSNYVCRLLYGCDFLSNLQFTIYHTFITYLLKKNHFLR